jgi:hypothetical protein
MDAPHVLSAGFPGGYTLLAHDRLYRSGNGAVESRELRKQWAEWRPQRQVLWRLRGEHVLADGTVVLAICPEALVGIKDADRNAHATLLAVAKGFNAPQRGKTAH